MFLRTRFRWLAIGAAIVGIAIILALGALWYDAHRTRAALLEQPVYRVLEKHDRALFDELLARYRRYHRGESSREEFVNFANARISEESTRSLAHASQNAVLALVADMLATARKLQTSPGDDCFRFWFPDVSGPPDIAKLVDADAQAHTFSLMGEVIRSAAEHPVPLPGQDEVSDNLARVINEIYEQFGTDAQMLAHSADPRVDRAKVCTITISLYERILRLPPEQASAVIRTMTQVEMGNSPKP
jgi:hypothetical protein